MRVVLMTTQLESGSMTDAFWAYDKTHASKGLKSVPLITTASPENAVVRQQIQEVI